MAHNYSKIYAPFKREGLKDKFVKVGLWQNPALEATQNLNWEWTEKIDGTSIGVKWDGERVNFVGHTDKAQIPPKLQKWLTEKFGTPEAESLFESKFGETCVTLYGEGISSETNYDYGFPDGNFIFYDIFCDSSNQFWSRETVHKLAEEWDLIEPVILYNGSIMEAVNLLIDTKENKIMSKLEPLLSIEGLVGRPPVELCNGRGERLITKVKYCDYGVK